MPPRSKTRASHSCPSSRRCPREMSTQRTSRAPRSTRSSPRIRTPRIAPRRAHRRPARDAGQPEPRRRSAWQRPVGALHGAFARDLRDLSAHPDPKGLYAVPYAVAYAPELMRAFTHLIAAADDLEASDEEFARYLRNRARDLLTNDYESGDASWVTGRFKRLNAQIGAYETYDDALFGVKAFHCCQPAAARTSRRRRSCGAARRAAGDRGRAAVRRTTSACGRTFRSASTT